LLVNQVTRPTRIPRQAPQRSPGLLARRARFHDQWSRSVHTAAETRPHLGIQQSRKQLLHAIDLAALLLQMQLEIEVFHASPEDAPLRTDSQDPLHSARWLGWPRLRHPQCQSYDGVQSRLLVPARVPCPAPMHGSPRAHRSPGRTARLQPLAGNPSQPPRAMSALISLW
jgi:hypothetical protein